MTSIRPTLPSGYRATTATKGTPTNQKQGAQQVAAQVAKGGAVARAVAAQNSASSGSAAANQGDAQSTRSNHSARPNSGGGDGAESVTSTGSKRDPDGLRGCPPPLRYQRIADDEKGLALFQAGQEEPTYMFVALNKAPATCTIGYRKERCVRLGVPDLDEARFLAFLYQNITFEFFLDQTNHAAADAARVAASVELRAKLVDAAKTVTVIDVAGSVRMWTAMHTKLRRWGDPDVPFGVIVHLVTDEQVSTGGPITSCKFNCDRVDCPCKGVPDWVVMRDAEWYPEVIRRAVELREPTRGTLVQCTYPLKNMFPDRNGKPTVRNEFADGKVHSTTDGPGGNGVTYVNDDPRGWLDAAVRDVHVGERTVRLHYELLMLVGTKPENQVRILRLSRDNARQAHRLNGPELKSTITTPALPGVGNGVELSVPARILDEMTVGGAQAATVGRLSTNAVRAAAYAAGLPYVTKGDITMEQLEAATAAVTARHMAARGAAAQTLLAAQAINGEGVAAALAPEEAVQACSSLSDMRKVNNAVNRLHTARGLAMAWAWLQLVWIALWADVGEVATKYVPTPGRLISGFAAVGLLLAGTWHADAWCANWPVWHLIIGFVDLLWGTGLLQGRSYSLREVHLGGGLLHVPLYWAARVGQPLSGLATILHLTYNACAFLTVAAAMTRGHSTWAAWWPGDPVGAGLAALAQEWVLRRQWAENQATGRVKVVPVFKVPPRPPKPGQPAYRTRYTKYTPPKRNYSLGLCAVVVGFAFVGFMPGMVASHVPSWVANRAQVEHEEPCAPEWDHSPVAELLELSPVVPVPLDDQKLDSKQKKVFEHPEESQPHPYEAHFKVENTMGAEGQKAPRLVIACSTEIRQKLIGPSRALHESLCARTKWVLDGDMRLVYSFGLNTQEIALAFALAAAAESVVLEADGRAYDLHEMEFARRVQGNAMRTVTGVDPTEGGPKVVRLPGGAIITFEKGTRITGGDDTAVGNTITNLESQAHGVANVLFKQAADLTASLRGAVEVAAEAIGATVGRGLTAAQHAALYVAEPAGRLVEELRKASYWAAGDDGLLFMPKAWWLTGRVREDAVWADYEEAWAGRGHPITGGVRSWRMATFCSQRFYPCTPFRMGGSGPLIRWFPGPLVGRGLYKLTSSFLTVRLPKLRGMMANDAKARLRTAAHVPFMRVALQWVVDTWGPLDDGTPLPVGHRWADDAPLDFQVQASEGDTIWDFMAAVYGDDLNWAAEEAQFRVALATIAGPHESSVLLLNMEFMGRLVAVDNDAPLNPRWCP